MGSPLGCPDHCLLGLNHPMRWIAEDLSLDKVKDLFLGAVVVVLIEPDGGGRYTELRAETIPYVDRQNSLVCHPGAILVLSPLGLPSLPLLEC